MELRAARPADLDQLPRLDDSFTTGTVFDVDAEPDRLTLRAVPPQQNVAAGKSPFR